MNQCQPIRNVGFAKGLTPSFNGTVNICSHRKSQFNKKRLENMLCWCYYHCYTWEAMNL